jgi:hypothetical protein
MQVDDDDIMIRRLRAACHTKRNYYMFFALESTETYNLYNSLLAFERYIQRYVKYLQILMHENLPDIFDSPEEEEKDMFVSICSYVLDPTCTEEPDVETFLCISSRNEIFKKLIEQAVNTNSRAFKVLVQFLKGDVSEFSKIFVRVHLIIRALLRMSMHDVAQVKYVETLDHDSIPSFMWFPPYLRAILDRDFTQWGKYKVVLRSGNKAPRTLHLSLPEKLF